MNILPPTMQRVANCTSKNINSKIKGKTLSRLNEDKDLDEEQLSQRIKKLDYEWDTERVMETGAASVMLLGSLIGYREERSGWYLLTGAAGIFLLQHALQGWCPSLPILRGLGIRTAEEINNEKTVLKAVRGDFAKETDDVGELLSMSEKE